MASGKRRRPDLAGTTEPPSQSELDAVLRRGRIEEVFQPGESTEALLRQRFPLGGWLTVERTSGKMSNGKVVGYKPGRLIVGLVEEEKSGIFIPVKTVPLRRAVELNPGGATGGDIYPDDPPFRSGQTLEPAVTVKGVTYTRVIKYIPLNIVMIAPGNGDPRWIYAGDLIQLQKKETPPQ